MGSSIARSIGLCSALGLAAACPATRADAPSLAPSSAAPPPLDAPAEPDAPREVLIAFMDGYVERHPVAASSMGRHDHDGRWPDLSATGRGEALEWAADMRARIEASRAAARREGACADELVDLDIARDELLRLELRSAHERTWTDDPLAYATLIGEGLDVVVAREYAPPPVRAQALLSRLRALPALTEQARANLSDPQRLELPATEVALAQLAGLGALLDGRVRELLASLPEADRPAADLALRQARSAIDQLREHVEGTSKRRLSSDDDNWRLGPELFEKKLALTLGLDRGAAEIYEEAVAEHARVRGEMASLADELWPVLFAETPPDDPDARTRDVLEALARVHVDAPKLRDAAEENLARLRRFVETRDLVPMRGAPPLEVIWTPPHQQGVAIAGLQAPPPLDDEALASTYLVQPVPADWDAERRESFLREYNHFMLEVLSIHEAIPGHYVQLWYGAHRVEGQPSVVRRAFQNGAFVEGWAVYGEWQMVQAGYAGAPLPSKFRRPRDLSRRTYRGLSRVLASDELRAKAIALHRLKFYLRTVTNAILDHEIHAGDMDRARAMALMVERSFQQEGEAAAKWVRAQVTSTQLSTYFVGASAWFALRADAEAQAVDEGRTFEPAAFHAAALSHGAPPVARLGELMATSTGPGDRCAPL